MVNLLQLIYWNCCYPHGRIYYLSHCGTKEINAQMVNLRGACQDYNDAWFAHENYSLKYNLENIPLTKPKFCKHSDLLCINADLPNQFSDCHCIKHYNFKFAKGFK